MAMMVATLPEKLILIPRRQSKSLAYLFGVFVIGVLTGVHGTDVQSAEPHPRSSLGPGIQWDKEGAAKYLDDRMDLWFAKAKKLGSDQGSTSCVSCHTVLPYVMSRPLLRKAMGRPEPTLQETRLVDETVRRVNSAEHREPLYKSKDEQSRGTEVILNLIVLENAKAGQGRLDMHEATLKALSQLWREQRGDGAWDWLDFGLEPYESADGAYYGAALAAWAVGSLPDSQQTVGADSNRVSRLAGYLRTNFGNQNLYNQVWTLLASTRLAGLLTVDQKTRLITELLDHQNPDGGWSLQKLGPWRWSKEGPPFGPEGKPKSDLLAESDGYATGLIVYTLRRAEWSSQAPALCRARAWLVDAQRELRIGQNAWKCWRTYSLNYDRENGGDEGESWRRLFMSDSATGFAALALLNFE